MKTLSPEVQAQLQDIAGLRVAFDKLERMFYSHDFGTLPGLVKPLLGSTLPAGVVQPQTEKQVIQIVNLASSHSIPLVSRGKSTSGYGGVIPTKGGLVVDFAWMDKVIVIDAEAMTTEEQMPDLMPAAMENLMPNMLPLNPCGHSVLWRVPVLAQPR